VLLTFGYAVEQQFREIQKCINSLQVIVLASNPRANSV